MEHIYTYKTRQRLVDNFQKPMIEKLTANPIIQTISNIFEDKEKSENKNKTAECFLKAVKDSTIFNLRTLASEMKENESVTDFFIRFGIDKYIPIFIKDENNRKDFLTFCENTNRFQCTVGYYRRSIRTKSYAPHMEFILQSLLSYCFFGIYKCSLEDYLTDNLSEEEKDFKQNYWGSFGRIHIDFMIAARLNSELKNNSTKLRDTITEIIMSENNTFVVTRDIIKGILMSDDTVLHELLGKFLLAARLQEGIRQAICESLDYGTVESFKTIFNVICENNLIRFSSVKRAVATWIGMINDNALDRFSNKTVDLMKIALNDENERNKMLKTDDAVQLLVGLWSYGFYDLDSVSKIIEDLATNGSRTQKLASAYYCTFISSIQNADFRKKQHRFALNAFINNSDDVETLAMYFSSLNLGLYHIKQKAIKYVNEKNGNYIKDGVIKKNIPVTYEDYQIVRPDLKEFFESEDEALLVFDSLYNFLKNLKKKEVKFEKVLFPWNDISISKCSISCYLCAIFYLCDLVRQNRKKEIFDAFPFIEYDYSYVEMVLNPNESDEIRNYLFNSIKTMKNRVIHFLNQIPIKEITDEQFQIIEQNLKYKDEDLNYGLETLIRKRNSNISISLKRMLESKEDLVRYSALKLLLEAKDKVERSDQNNVKDFVNISDFENSVSNLKEKAEEKEKILIDRILGVTQKDNSSPKDFYKIENFTKVFEKSSLNSSKFAEGQKAIEDFSNSFNAKKINSILAKFDELIKEHQNDQYKDFEGNDHTLGEKPLYRNYGTIYSTSNNELPFLDLWEKFFEGNIKDKATTLALYYMSRIGQLYRAYVKVIGDEEKMIFDIEKTVFKTKEKNISVGEFDYSCCTRTSLFTEILNNIWLKKFNFSDFAYGAISNITFNLDINLMFPEVESNSRFYESINRKNRTSYFERLESIESLLSLFGTMSFYNSSKIANLSDNDFIEYFKLFYILSKKIFDADLRYYYTERYLYIEDYLRAFALNLISKDDIYFAIVENIGASTALKTLNTLAFETDENKISRIYKNIDSEILFQIKELSKEILLNFSNEAVKAEVRRGTTKTNFTDFITKIPTFYGIENTVQVLKAMGKDKFVRSSYSFYSNIKTDMLCYVLKHSKPFDFDTKEDFKNLVLQNKIAEKRLYEFAMYNPIWIPFISYVLEIKNFESGCYYFIAHMNEKMDEREESVVAKYTSVSPADLQKGSFALDWFNELFEEIGEENFNKIYDSAKYISDGAKHARARKFADAALGRVTESELEAEIDRARNKDLLMSYSLIPINSSNLTEKRNILVHRYEYLQKFAKQSKKFGSQRRASETLALEVAYDNLSRLAGYSDVNRLFLNMESALIDSLKSYFDWQKVEKDGKTICFVKLDVDSDGKPNLQITKDLETKDKNGNIKLQKSVPAAAKKNEIILEISDVQKRLKAQHQRTRLMFESFMCDSVLIPLQELMLLTQNPIVNPILSKILFIDEENKIGFLSAFSQDDENKNLRIAHCFDLYKNGKWHEWQKYIFDEKIVQPFKQVFRELYLKLDEEAEKSESLMFAGNQIQPKKTVATLKSRKWISGYYYDEGLFKVFRKENIIAEIYAVCDWYTPSDIECPTIDSVNFCHRIYKKDEKKLRIKDIPDILYSEVMRDVDLVVSVAHAGGVDPETSHSTIEMRKAILNFTLPLFKINNVKIEKNFAFINGTRSNYQIHLGSGLVRKEAGSVIYVIAVGSQQRGKIFLPFVDEDPKTAEIITKIVMFSRDNEIKDPQILQQI